MEDEEEHILLAVVHLKLIFDTCHNVGKQIYGSTTSYSFITVSNLASLCAYNCHML